jgi:hypothetical protein
MSSLETKLGSSETATPSPARNAAGSLPRAMQESCACAGNRSPSSSGSAIPEAARPTVRRGKRKADPSEPGRAQYIYIYIYIEVSERPITDRARAGSGWKTGTAGDLKGRVLFATRFEGAAFCNDIGAYGSRSANPARNAASSCARSRALARLALAGRSHSRAGTKAALVWVAVFRALLSARARLP